MLGRKAQRLIALNKEEGGEFHPEYPSSPAQLYKPPESKFSFVNGKARIECPVQGDPWRIKADLQTADNILTVEKLIAHITTVDQMCTSDAMYGTGTGHIELKQSVADLFKCTFFKGRDDLSPENIIISNGAGPLVAMAVDALCDDGEAVIIIAPYWSNFKLCVNGLSRGVIFPTEPSSADGFRFHESHLTRAYNRANQVGKRVGCVILTSPTNPTGHVYSRDELITIFRWCERNEIHLIVDEIYALSTYRGEFISISDVLIALQTPWSPYVHVVWSFSKDFNISGFRVGAFYSENSAVRTAMTALSYLFRSSTLAQFVLRDFLTHTALVREFITENKRNLLESYNVVATTLQQHGIKFIPAHAGFFVFIDLRELRIPEADLLLKMQKDADIWLSAGTPMGIEEEGWFRVTFGAYSKETMKIFMDRLGNFVQTNTPTPVHHHH